MYSASAALSMKKRSILFGRQTGSRSKLDAKKWNGKKSHGIITEKSKYLSEIDKGSLLKNLVQISIPGKERGQKIEGSKE